MSTFQIKEILTSAEPQEFKGNQEHQIASAIGIEEALAGKHPAAMTWINDKKSQEIKGKQINAGLLVLSKTAYTNLAEAKTNFLIVENPRAVFFQVVEKFFKSSRAAKIESSAVIDQTSAVGNNCYIGHHVVIEANCRIGDNTTILHNTAVLAGTIIGNNVIIGCNNTIGNYGFGYEKDSAGEYFPLHHAGNVIIHDKVEIHNNTCIDRGVLGPTEIHENVKIDNLVHIAHGVSIGRNSLVIANAMIAGSTRVGENSWIAPSVSIKNKSVIAAGTVTGIGAVVLKDTERDTTYVGNPATTMDEYKEWSAVRKRALDAEKLKGNPQ